MDAANRDVATAVGGIFDSTPRLVGGQLIDPAGLRGPIPVPQSLMQRFHLRPGQEISGMAVGGGPGRLIRVETIDGLPPAERAARLQFSRATTTSPHRFLRTETDGTRLTTRVIDLFAPIGRGQRGLIVAPPRTGKTTILRDIANGILANEPDCHVMILLVDERPEEVTDFRRGVPAELFASSNDEPIAHHLHTAQLAFQRAQCLVEVGRSVVLLLDSITRLARAFNSSMARSGRTMTGGLDAQALEKPRQLFALARETEELGSLTVIATALVETGSRMDDLIFQEFKGTGNWELVLDRRAAELRLFPAVQLPASGTRKEELLISADALAAAGKMRRALSGTRSETALETLLSRLGKTRNNGEFIALVNGH